MSSPSLLMIIAEGCLAVITTTRAGPATTLAIGRLRSVQNKARLGKVRDRVLQLLQLPALQGNAGTWAESAAPGLRVGGATLQLRQFPNYVLLPFPLPPLGLPLEPCHQVLLFLP